MPIAVQFENPGAYKPSVIATGLPASPGAAVGQIVFSAEEAEAAHAQGKSVILVNRLLSSLWMQVNSIRVLYSPWERYIRKRMVCLLRLIGWTRGDDNCTLL